MISKIKAKIAKTIGMIYNPKCAIFVVKLETQFRELLRVAKLLRNLGRYHVLFYFDDPNPASLKRMKRICSIENMAFIPSAHSLVSSRDGLPDGIAQGSDEAGQALTASPFKCFIKILKDALPENVSRKFIFFWYLFVYINQIRDARKLINSIRPDIIVVAEDGLGANRAIIKQSKIRKIPILVVPYEYSTITQPAEAIINTYNYRNIYGTANILNQIVARIFPKWAYKYKGETLLRDQGSSIVWQELLGLAPLLPWAVHGGNADKIAVECEVMLSHYLNQGIAEDKLVLTGALYDDDLSKVENECEKCRHDLYQSLDLPAGRRMILCAVPPDHVAIRPYCDFKSYKDLLDFWVETLLALNDINIIFQLHPRVTPEQAEYIESKGGKIVRQDITTLIPLCDILVTSVSSIIRMAIACKKPVLNYDVYKFGYSDYESACGVITIESKEEFLKYLNRLVEDRVFYSEVSSLQGACAYQWGMHDGHSGHRIIDLFDKLIEKNPQD